MPTFKQYVDSMATGSPVAHIDNPFYEATIKGHHEWGKSTWSIGWAHSGSHDLVKIHDIDNPFSKHTSGAIKLQVKEGWEIKLDIISGNIGYFDNVTTSSIIEAASDQQIVTWLRGGDWLSIDIDSEWAGINTFTLRNPQTTWSNLSRMGFGPTDGSAWVRIVNINKTGGGASYDPDPPPVFVHDPEPPLFDPPTFDDVDDTLTKYLGLIAIVVIGIAVIQVSGTVRGFQ